MLSKILTITIIAYTMSVAVPCEAGLFTYIFGVAEQKSESNCDCKLVVDHIKGTQIWDCSCKHYMSLAGMQQILAFREPENERPSAERRTPQREVVGDVIGETHQICGNTGGCE